MGTSATLARQTFPMVGHLSAPLQYRASHQQGLAMELACPVRLGMAFSTLSMSSLAPITRLFLISRGRGRRSLAAVDVHSPNWLPTPSMSARPHGQESRQSILAF